MEKTTRTRELLLTVTKDLLMQHHYDQIKVSDITSLAKVSKGTFFYHFDSKENIVIEIFRELFLWRSKFIKELANTPNLSVKKRFENLVLDQLKPYYTEDEFSVLIENVPKTYYLYLDHIRCQIFSPIIYQLVQEGINEGVFTPYDNPEILTTILYNGISGTIYCAYLKTNSAIAYQMMIDAIQTLLTTVLGTEIKLEKALTKKMVLEDLSL